MPNRLSKVASRFGNWITGRSRTRRKEKERQAINALLDITLDEGDYVYAQQLLGRLGRPMEPVEADRLVESMLHKLDTLHTRSQERFAQKTTLMGHLETVVARYPVSEKLVERAARRVAGIDAKHVVLVAQAKKITAELRAELITQMFGSDVRALDLHRVAALQPNFPEYMVHLIQRAIEEGDAEFASTLARSTGRELTEAEREYMIRGYLRNSDSATSWSLDGAIEKTERALAA